LEDDLSVHIGLFVFQILNKDGTVWGHVYFSTLANVGTNSQERNFLVIGALLRREFKHLGRELILDGLDRIELMSMV